MVLCTNCKHFSDPNRCYNPKLGISRVSGKHIWSYCREERVGGWLFAKIESVCGKEGRWFEPKNSDLNKNA